MLEGTSEFNRRFEEVLGRYEMEREQQRRIVQGIQGEYWYGLCRDAASRDDEMYHRLQELVEEAVLTPDEAYECYGEFLRVYGENYYGER